MRVRRAPLGAILLFHSVAVRERDAWGLTVSPQALESQLYVLADAFRIVSLDDLIAGRPRGKAARATVALTFDDGYANNLSAALPLLERHGAPATVFVTTGYLGRPDPFWWDELEDLVAGPGDRPERLEVTLDGKLLTIDTASPDQRREALGTELEPALRRSPLEEIDRVMEDMRAWAGRRSNPADVGRCLTAEELSRLASSELIEIGAHGRSHSSLPTMAAEAQRAEIEGPRDVLAEVTGTPPRGFAYPFGDHRRGTRRLLREAGYEQGLALAGRGPVRRGGDPLRLPRVGALEEDGAALVRRLAQML